MSSTKVPCGRCGCPAARNNRENRKPPSRRNVPLCRDCIESDPHYRRAVRRGNRLAA